MLLPELAGAQEAVLAAGKIRATVEAAAFADVGRLTVSVGVSLVLPDDADAGPLIARADAAPYEAKRGGRNAVVLNAPGASEAPVS
ncbi:diguanylate cyclase domain-containing protein [Roseateles saccharophilus]|uniref:diguanylate cyclase domain-containing protein n=1 Tax=Roseateles saccharophilus TaxID=304 RepID=UPI001AA00C17|nr:diguanylate cyclase [Roseateles saccharophilus]